MRHEIILAACAVLVACGGRDPVDSRADNTAGLPDIDAQAPQPTGAAPANAKAPAIGTAAAPAIPSRLHGRWGLTPGDCTSTIGDAKGLLVISADELRFYESVGRPTASAQADADSISGTFSFTGEGQSWSRYEALALQGRDLVRTESNPTASFTYAKCD